MELSKEWLNCPQERTLKLYMPLTANLYEFDRYGDVMENCGKVDGWELLTYKEQILEAIIDERLPEEAESGLMYWYDKDDGVSRKVRSAVFTVEEREGRLWGVAECKTVGELTPDEMGVLKEYIAGQASDGWGEGFEQNEVNIPEGKLYVHLWNWDNWSIRTEDEQFSHKLSEGTEMGGMNLE